MSLQVEKLENNMAKLTIEVEAERFEKAIEDVYRKQRNKITIPGFRRGKAPRKMIENMYGAGVFYEDAANALIPDAYDEALAECEEEIVSTPKIEAVQIEAGKPFIFTAEVALKPEVKLGRYKGVEVERIDTTVTEEEVDAEIEKEREKNGRSITVEDRPVEDGDEVVLDYEGFVDGVAFEGGKGENHSLTIGSGEFIPGFEEQLVGAEIGKEVELNVTFPEEYHEASLQGKEAVFKCTVHEIRRKELPELDDEFASEVSDFDTLEEYREDVRKNLTEKKEAEAKTEKENAVIEAIIEDAEMEIPEAMLTTQQRQMADDFVRRLQMQGLSLEQYFQFTGLTYDRLLEQVRPNAEQRIHSRLVLEAVADAENIEVSEEEYEAELQRMAESYRMELDKVREMIGDGEKKQIMKDLAVQKAVDFVTENAEEVEPAATEDGVKEE